MGSASMAGLPTLDIKYRLGGASAFPELRRLVRRTITPARCKFLARPITALSKAQVGPSWLILNGGLAYTQANGDLQPSVEVAWGWVSVASRANTPQTSA